MSIGKIIRSKRKELDLTLDDIAKVLKVQRQTIFKYENDIINIPSDKIIKLCEILKCSPNELLEYKNKKG